MSRTPRTPEHFPRMKHRAAGRAIRKERRLWRESLARNVADFPAAFDGLRAAFVAMAATARHAADAFAEADVAWGTPQPPTLADRIALQGD